MAKGQVLTAHPLKTGNDTITENRNSSGSKQHSARGKAKQQKKRDQWQDTSSSNCAEDNILHAPIADGASKQQHTPPTSSNKNDPSPSLPRKVSFAKLITIKRVRKIPKKYAQNVWYTGTDMHNFRMEVLNCKDLRFRVKLKSARCHNHMRRVLLEHRVSKADSNYSYNTTASKKKGAAAAKKYLRKQKDIENLSNASMKSSAKTKEAARKTADLLEQEIVGEQSMVNSKISSACFGVNHRWVFDYYLGLMVDNMCSTI